MADEASYSNLSVKRTTTTDERQIQQDAGPAATKVLTTVELLEAVLLEVDMKRLLLAQRVDRTWQATNKGSIKLQEKLWFRTPSSHTTAGKMEVNPLLFRQDLHYYPRGTRYTAFINPSELFIKPRSIYLKDFLMLIRGRHHDAESILRLDPGSWQEATLFRQPLAGMQIYATYMAGESGSSSRHLKRIRLSELPSNTAGELVECLRDRVTQSESSGDTTDDEASVTTV